MPLTGEWTPAAAKGLDRPPNGDLRPPDVAESPPRFGVRRVATDRLAESTFGAGSVTFHEKNVAAKDGHAGRAREHRFVEIEDGDGIGHFVGATGAKRGGIERALA